jgi:hypothetical protein
MHKNLLACKSLLREEQFQLIRYEDIVDTPETTLTEICNFIGVVYDPVMAQKIHGNSKTKWNDDPYFTLTIDSEVIKMANTFGYAASALENDNTKQPSAWKLFVWNIDTMFLKLKNKIINRLLMPILLKLKLKK